MAAEGSQCAVCSPVEGRSLRGCIPVAEDIRRVPRRKPGQDNWMAAGLGCTVADPAGMAVVDHTAAGAVGMDIGRTVLGVGLGHGSREEEHIG